MKSPVNSKSARVALLRSDGFADTNCTALFILPTAEVGLLRSAKLLPRPVASRRVPLPSSSRQYAIRQLSNGDPLGVGKETHCDMGVLVEVGVGVAVAVGVKVGVAVVVRVDVGEEVEV